MNILQCAGLSVSTSVLALSLAAPAYAQDTGPEGERAAATNQAATQNAIIVTARRIEENLQDVPISITVYDQEQLDKRNIAIASDLATYTPSLSVNTRFGPEKPTFAIRGFNQETSTAPTVGVYFADVVGLRAQGGTTSGNSVGAGAFMDLQNVQILKGPQGTLFGRNTTGGAILLVPQRPTDEFEGFIEGTVGNYDHLRAQGAINIPLAETFKVRFAADRFKRDGYMKNVSGIGPKDYNDTNYFGARMSILADLTPDLENYTIVQYSNSFTNGYAAKLLQCNPRYNPNDPAFIFNTPPSADPRARPNPRLLLQAPGGCAQIDRTADSGPLTTEVGVSNPFIDIEQWQVINTTTLVATDWLTIKNIASYGEFREDLSFAINSDNLFVQAVPNNIGDPAYDPFAIPAGDPRIGLPVSSIRIAKVPGQNAAAQSTFVEELQFQGNMADGRLMWQAGAYLERSRPLGVWSRHLMVHHPRRNGRMRYGTDSTRERPHD